MPSGKREFWVKSYKKSEIFFGRPRLRFPSPRGLGLGNKLYLADNHLFIHCFAHVVDGQRSHTDGRKGFHLHPSLGRDAGGGKNADSGALPRDLKLYFAMRYR